MDGWLLAQCSSRLESIYPVVRPLQSIGDGYMVLKRPDPYLFDQGHARDPTKQRTQHMKWPVSSTGWKMWFVLRLSGNGPALDWRDYNSTTSPSTLFSSRFPSRRNRTTGSLSIVLFHIICTLVRDLRGLTMVAMNKLEVRRPHTWGCWMIDQALPAPCICTCRRGGAGDPLETTTIKSTSNISDHFMYPVLLLATLINFFTILVP